MISDFIREPLLRNINIDGPERILAHRQILESKPLMKDVCKEIYSLCAQLDRRFLSGSGTRIELGAGVSFIKDFFSDVIVTDIVPAPHLDAVLDAQQMTPISDGSVRSFFAVHCFHHLPAPRKFFSELSRTLSPGGGCILVEPYFGPIARLVYPKLFASEKFDMEQESWDTPGSGAMSDANQALSYCVLFRDRKKLLDEFPSLSIVHSDQLRHYIRYVLSGGLNFRSLAPNWSAPLLRLLETMLSPARRALALHHVIVIRKQAESV